LPDDPPPMVLLAWKAAHYTILEVLHSELTILLPLESYQPAALTKGKPDEDRAFAPA